MHASVMTWVRKIVKALKLADKDVIEVGSYDVNGSVRPLFTGKYIGVDMRPGPGVDLVAEALKIPFLDASVDVVVSTEMLEHDPRPWLSMREMARLVRPGGYVILTARGYGFPEHNFPADYWRFSVSSFRVLIEDAGLKVLIVRPDTDPLDNPGVFGLARKPL